ncbi:hypothetical protein ACQUSR_11510 [Streptomyces sp. P1-3]|uniref:hypothetical protein n=1 Tax=Streptomyces sp. P1-3 TaxID=3421658 RepID=UPI003D359FC6
MTDERPRARQRQRKQVLLRLDPAVHDALARWADDELRSANAQIEFLLRRALAEAGRLPGNAGPMPRRGRPPRAPADDERSTEQPPTGQSAAEQSSTELPSAGPAD